MTYPVRILCLDLGRRRVGMAITDELGLTAQPLSPIEINGMPELLEKLAPVIDGNRVSSIVLGRPVRLNGEDTHMTGFAEKARVLIESRFGIIVEMWDERYTSKIAQQAIHSAGEKLKKKKQALDSISASIILSDYLRFHATKDTD